MNLRNRHLVPGTLSAAAFLASTFTEALVDSLFVPGAINGSKVKESTLPQTTWDAEALGRASDMIMDASAPSTTAGLGMVVGTATEAQVTAPGGTLTAVITTGGEVYNHLGVHSTVTGGQTITGFAIPVAGGFGVIDVVVVDSTGAVQRRAGTAGAIPVAPALTTGDVPLASVLLTQGVDVSVEAGNITDLRSRTAIVPSKIGLPSAEIMVGDNSGRANPVAVTGDIDLLNTGDVTITTNFSIPVNLYGPWAVDGDGTYTNGGGLVGTEPNLIPADYAFVYDFGTTSFAPLATSDSLGDFTLAYQLLPDFGVAEANDAFYLGFTVPVCEIGFDLSTPATWGGAGMVYEYWDGAAWSALTIGGVGAEGYDNTETATFTGLQSLRRSGAITFEPPTDWAANVVNAQNAYWVRGRMTAATLTASPVCNGTVPVKVLSVQGTLLPHGISLNNLIFNNGNATLHAAPVVVVAYDSSTGEHRKFSWNASTRKNRKTMTTWPLSRTTSRLHWFLIREAGANEPSNVSLEIEGTYR